MDANYDHRTKQSTQGDAPYPLPTVLLDVVSGQAKRACHIRLVVISRVAGPLGSIESNTPSLSNH